MKTFEKIYSLVTRIPKGKVMTYGQISKLTNINNPRVVGFALHLNKNPKIIPCHRVVHFDGSLAKDYAFGGLQAQKERLEKEGVRFLKEKVNLRISLLKS